jgi:ABC-2 type transport system ATP-binding protein
MIKIEGLTKNYGATEAVRDLSFVAHPGRVTGFLGPNGSGKTTTLRVLLGLTRPTAGRATVGGRTFAELDAPARAVGAVLEGSTFHPGRSGRNHLRVLARMAQLPETRVDDVLRLVDLDDSAARARVSTYSFGMRQRLSLAAALLGNPDALVLDEPSNGLDPEGIRWLRQFVRALAAEGRTVLMSSHVLSEVAQTVDDVVLIRKGRLITSSSLEALTSASSAPEGPQALENAYLELMGGAV